MAPASSAAFICIPTAVAECVSEEECRPGTAESENLPDFFCGRICLGRKKINFSTVFAGQAVGIKEVHDDIWLVSFMDPDLGYFDLETRVLEPLDNPSDPRLSAM
jgi:hypothetical protein